MFKIFRVLDIGEEYYFCIVINSVYLFVMDVIVKWCKEIVVVYDVGEEYVSYMLYWCFFWFCY